MTKGEAIQTFFSSFGLPAYEETSVPRGACLPYITYEGTVEGWGESVPLSASLWYEADASVADVNAKCGEIGGAIGQSGLLLDCDGGKIWLSRGTPFAFSVGAEGARRKALNLRATYLTRG